MEPGVRAILNAEKPMRVFTLSGARLQVQPLAHDTAKSLQARVAAELSVPHRSIEILHECLPLPDHTMLTELGRGDLQIVVNSIEEESSGEECSSDCDAYHDDHLEDNNMDQEGP
jgi:hypothetical protein